MGNFENCGSLGVLMTREHSHPTFTLIVSVFKVRTEKDTPRARRYPQCYGCLIGRVIRDPPLGLSDFRQPSSDVGKGLFNGTVGRTQGSDRGRKRSAKHRQVQETPVLHRELRCHKFFLGSCSLTPVNEQVKNCFEFFDPRIALDRFASDLQQSRELIRTQRGRTREVRVGNLTKYGSEPIYMIVVPMCRNDEFDVAQCVVPEATQIFYGDGFTGTARKT
jgi:hypothetical protein